MCKQNITIIYVDSRKSKKSKTKDDEVDELLDFEDDDTQDSMQDAGINVPRTWIFNSILLHVLFT